MPFQHRVEATGAPGSLTAADLSLHQRLGIPPDLLNRAGVRRLSDFEARQRLSKRSTAAGDFGGIEYVYRHPILGYQNTSRVRLDHPPLKADGGPDGKYQAPYGDVRHLYFPPNDAAFLSDVAIPSAIVESEKASLALVAAAQRAGRQLLVIATGGNWAWRGVIGKDVDAAGARVDVKGALADFDLVAWTGRKTYILFDANPNASTEAGRRALARELRQRGAEVLHGHLPNDDDRVNGPDDLIAAHGDPALWRVIDQANPDDFTRSKSGAILVDSLDNVRLALRRLRIELTYNAFTRETLINGKPADDLGVDQVWVAINDRCHFNPSKDVVRTIITTEAISASLHPVLEYLDGLRWDGVPRLDRWLTTYGGADPSEYVEAVGALPLIAAVRRIRRPGVKFDELLVVEATQGTLKSTAIRTLCPDDSWFSDDLPLGVDSKQVIERTAGKWIIEAAEMHGNRGREAEQLKAFLSRQIDGPVRLAYGRLPVSVPRQFILIGTTNATIGYLKDPTGARRFWPVRVQRFDVEALRRDRDQLWAEAAHREAAGASIGLAPDLWRAAGEHQEQRRAGDPWEDILEQLFEDEPERVSVESVWKALGVEAKSRDNRHADRVRAILQRYGYVTKEKFRTPQAANPAWHWVRVPSSSEHCSGQSSPFAFSSKCSKRSKHSYREETESVSVDLERL